MKAGEESDFSILQSKNSERLQIKINGEVENYKILKFFEFTAERKLMSVVVKCENDGRTYIFTKGADGTVIPLAKVKGQDEQSKIC